MRQTIPTPLDPRACDATAYANVIRTHFRNLAEPGAVVRATNAADGWTFGTDVNGDEIPDEESAVAAWWSSVRALPWGAPLTLAVALLLALPVQALELTWQTRPNMAMSTTSADYADRNMQWSFIAALDGNTDASVWNGTAVAGKWTHMCSNDSTSDTAASSTDCNSATDEWAATSGTWATGKIVAAAANSAHSWYVARSPVDLSTTGAYVYLNWDVVSATAPTVWISKTKPGPISRSCTITSGNTTVTIADTSGLSIGQFVVDGLTDIPTNATIASSITTNTSFVLSAAPTASGSRTCTFRGGYKGRWGAADEVQANTVGLDTTWASPSQHRTHMSISSRGDFVWFTSRDSAATFYQMVFGAKLQDSKTSDVFPFVIGSASNSWTDATHGLRSSVQIKGRDYANAAAVGYTTVTWAIYNGSGWLLLWDNGAGLPGTGLSASDYGDSKYDDGPIYVLSNTTNYVSLRGRLPDIRFGPSTLANLTTASSTGAAPYDSVIYSTGYSRVWWPWVSSTAPTP